MTIAARAASLAVALMAGVALLTACATPTPYHPASATDPAHADGYREARIEPGRWRVAFSGNSLTSRETVETYLLYRAAELTLQNGHDWFHAVERDTEEHVTLVVRQGPRPDGDPRAFDAREVKASLEHRIVRPES